MNEQEVDAVIVGAGALGASIAYHLSKAGRKVALVERGAIGSGCTSATYAGINVSAKEGGCYLKFTLDASRLYLGIEDELDADVEYYNQGSHALVVERESDWPAALRNVEELNRVPGINMEVLPTPKAQLFEPALPKWIQGATFCPVDGFLNPHKLVNAYVRAASRLGAIVQTYTEVREIEVKSGVVQAAVTSSGKIHTPLVINAAGVDAPSIGRMVGASIPVVPAHGQVITTARVRPFLRYPMRGLVQKRSGNLFVGTTKKYIGPTHEVRPELLPGAISKALRLFPFLCEAPAVRIWVGVRPWPIDGLPILGPVSGVKGFLVAATHSGITLADMIGHVITDLVVHGNTSVEIDHYHPDRFKGDQLSFVTKMFGNMQVLEPRLFA